MGDEAICQEVVVDGSMPLREFLRLWRPDGDLGLRFLRVSDESTGGQVTTITPEPPAFDGTEYRIRQEVSRADRDAEIERLRAALERVAAARYEQEVVKDAEIERLRSENERLLAELKRAHTTIHRVASELESIDLLPSALSGENTDG